MECDTNSDLHYFGWYEYPREYATSCKNSGYGGWKWWEMCNKHHVLADDAKHKQQQLPKNSITDEHELLWQSKASPKSLFPCSTLKHTILPKQIIFTFTFLPLMSTNILQHDLSTHHNKHLNRCKEVQQKKKSPISKFPLCRCISCCFPPDASTTCALAYSKAPKTHKVCMKVFHQWNASLAILRYIALQTQKIKDPKN